MKNNLKNIIFVLIFSILFLGGRFAYASSVLVSPSKESVGMDEEFYVDLLINTEGAFINGIEGQIIFDNNLLSFVRAEEGKSIINLWIDKPEASVDSIKFSGIIPNGFDGIIDPFNSKDKLPGNILRLVFKGLKPGSANISLLNFKTTLNDGSGTLNEIPSSEKNINIQNVRNPFIYKSSSDIHPELNFEIIKDQNIYNGRYVLIFDARDKETGIDKVMIKEGSRKWIPIESPYLLKDQTRHSNISILATNHSGVSIVKNIEGIPYKLFTPASIAVALIIIIISFLFIAKKIYAKKIVK